MGNVRDDRAPNAAGASSRDGGAPPASAASSASSERSDLVLVQVKSRDWPSTLERQVLCAFPAPPNARKLLHRWRDRQRLPDVQEL